MTIKDYVDRAKADYDEVFEAGKKSEYDKFWDAFQDYGNRYTYGYTFYGGTGGAENFANWFYPKYDIKPTRAEYFMRDAKMYKGDKTLDLVERLNECGVKMDFSQCTTITYLFYNARVSHLPEINVTSAGVSANYVSFGNYIETIDKFIFNKAQTLADTFLYCSRLKNIVFEGLYEMGGAKLQDAKSLSKESLISFINCLSTEVSGKAITLSLIAVNKAFETTEGANDGSTSSEWLTLTGTKSNWTISLA